MPIKNQYIAKLNSLFPSSLLSRNGAILARGTAGSLFTKLAGMGVLFGVHVLLARLLGPDQYGIYIYAINCIDMVAVLCLLGYHTSLVRFVAEYRVTEQWGYLRGVLRSSTKVVAIASFLVGIVLVLILLNIKGKLSESQFETFLIGTAVLPIFCLCWLRESTLRALKRIVQSQILLKVIRPLSVGILAIGIYLWTEQLKASWVMACNLVAVFIVFLIGTDLMRRGIKHEIFAAEPMYRTKFWIAVSVPMLLIATMQWALKRTDVIMIGSYLGTKEAGLYSTASEVSGVVELGLASVNSILGPMISEFYHSGNMREMRKVVTLAARAVLILMVSATIVMSLGGKIVLGLYGKEFVSAYLPLLILLGGEVINAIVGPAGVIMTMIGHQNQLGIILGLGTLVNVGLNVVLIPRMGIVGAAIASATSMVLWNVLMFCYVSKVLGLNPTVFGGHFKKSISKL